MPAATHKVDRISIAYGPGLVNGIANGLLLSCAMWVAVGYLIYLI